MLSDWEGRHIRKNCVKKQCSVDFLREGSGVSRERVELVMECSGQVRQEEQGPAECLLWNQETRRKWSSPLVLRNQ